MRRAFLSVMTMGLLFGTVGKSHAVVTGWNIDHTPVRLGETTTWTVSTGNPWAEVLSYKWEMQGVGKTGTLGTWVDLMVDASSTTRTMARVGRFNVRLTVKYRSVMGTPAHDDTIIDHLYVVVVPPDGDEVVAGLNTPTALDELGLTRLPVEFEMRDGSTAIGGQINGYVQENILLWDGFNPVTSQWYAIPHQMGWGPPPPPLSTLFFLSGNRIVDRKAVFCEAPWHAVFPMNFTFMKVMQVNRLVVLNWISEPVTVTFPEHSFTMQKAGASTWVLVE